MVPQSQWRALTLHLSRGQLHQHLASPKISSRSFYRQPNLGLENTQATATIAPRFRVNDGMESASLIEIGAAWSSDRLSCIVVANVTHEFHLKLI